MNTLNSIRRSVANHSDDVFLRGEFNQFGSVAQVGRALRTLMMDGTLVRLRLGLGLGVYANANANANAKAKPSVPTGKPIPVRPLEVLAPQALNKLGVTVMPSRLTQEYNAGRSAQVPASIVFNVGRRRIARKLGFNGKAIQYERA
ncbi:conserved hypothetical protein [Acidovorax delafieldii 2AN]|uniref:S-adenosylhomocysteine hydrolase n=1 Tax=Acidovorax delafieldii 2AN TaxID=573060 RepID=C5T083_ACIDE|nr:hypothetical protein [Acidovorax delafieldii]EER62191.1 conserved hypothetical protein [Acidovorax delafieldii 2AN]